VSARSSSPRSSFPRRVRELTYVPYLRSLAIRLNSFLLPPPIGDLFRRPRLIVILGSGCALSNPQPRDPTVLLIGPRWVLDWSDLWFPGFCPIALLESHPDSLPLPLPPPPDVLLPFCWLSVSVTGAETDREGRTIMPV